MSKDKKYWLPGFNPRRTNSSILSLNVITDKDNISDDEPFKQLWEKNFARFCFEKLCNGSHVSFRTMSNLETKQHRVSILS